MTDVLTSVQRSYCMSRIRGKDTKPELILRKALSCHGLRYRLKNKLPGRPDIVFHRQRTVIFIDGCFWHMCPKHFTLPRTNRKFWKVKLNENLKRDCKINKELKKQGWTVIRLWEHQIENNLNHCVKKVSSLIKY